MRDIAARLDETLDRDALFEMLAIIPTVEIGFIGRVDVHRCQQHAFSGERHSRISLSRHFGRHILGRHIRDRLHHGVADAGVV